jgi:hypothetical protein
MMSPALVALIDELARPLGPVPPGPGHRVEGGAWMQPPVVSPAHLVERILLGHALEPQEQVWFTRLLTLGLLRLLCFESCAAPYDPAKAVVFTPTEPAADPLSSAPTPTGEAAHPAAASLPRAASTGEMLLGAAV